MQTARNDVARLSMVVLTRFEKMYFFVKIVKNLDFGFQKSDFGFQKSDLGFKTQNF